MPTSPTPPSPRRRLLPRPLLVLLTLLATVLALSVPGNGAAAPSRPAPKHAKPTIVLVHGAWADGSGWNKVVARLQRAGYPVRVPPNPLRSLPGDSATLASFLSTVTGPIILVGHSYGGAVITNAATGDPDVKALVYINAFAPDEGEVVFPLAGADSALAAPPETVFDFVPYPGAPEGDVDLYLKEDLFLSAFASGVPTRAARILYATQRPIAFSAGSQPSGVPAWATIPSWYLLGNRDQIITPTAQRSMAERAGSRIVTIKAGHLSLVSHPGAVTRLITRAAHSIS